MKALLCTLLLLLAIPQAFAQPVIVDGSTAATTKSSLISILDSLTDEKKVEFSIALLQIQLAGVQSGAQAKEANLHNTLNFDVLSSRVDGLTYEEILALAAPPQAVKESAAQ